MQTKTFYRKLVRDKLPEIISATGGKYEIRKLSEAEFESELKQKLIEEAKELQNAPSHEVVDELADVLELVKQIAKLYKISFKDVTARQTARRQSRGGFAKRIFLIWSSKPSKPTS